MEKTYSIIRILLLLEALLALKPLALRFLFLGLLHGLRIDGDRLDDDLGLIIFNNFGSHQSSRLLLDADFSFF